MSELQSHSDPQKLLLREHLDQIREAGAAILVRHGAALSAQCPELADWFAACVTLHDAGKASAAFQRYIHNPPAFRGDKKAKAHTPLSLLFTTRHGPAAGWGWRKTLAVAQVAAGHHGEFRDLDALEEVVACFGNYLREQLAGLDYAALCRAVGADLPPIDAAETDDAVDAVADLRGHWRAELDALPLVHAARYRLQVQLTYSVLLEADKAFLAVPERDRAAYLAPRRAEFPPALVKDFLATKPAAAVNGVRAAARAALDAGAAEAGDAPVLTLTLPTGTGKTLLAASWALETRERLRRANGGPPLVLVVLPFLTVIEQTAKEYRDLLGGAAAGGELTNYHSLSDRTFAKGLEDESQDFFLDTWKSDVVVTTFDQFLYALLSPKARHQMRFHHLTDAVIVLDEVQAFPVGLWEPLRLALAALTTLGSTRLLAMTATQPGFLPDARELVPDARAIFAGMKRYRIMFRRREQLGLSAFIAECNGRLKAEWRGKRVMLTLNTRRSARRVRDGLVDVALSQGFAVEFLTADVTPMDRLEAVEKVKKHAEAGTPCLVVSTQCVEAGVDIDLDFVVRDFGPLDSVIQVAGRCNRNGKPGRGTVEVVELFDDESPTGTKSFASMVYDKVLLGATAEAFGQREGIDEEDIYDLTAAYFADLKRRKDCGGKAAEDWARWREPDASVRELLRGAERPQVTFVVTERDPGLADALDAARAVVGRWARRRALRALAGRLARVSVSVYARPDFKPADYGDPFPPDAKRDDAWFWLLKPGQYKPATGIEFRATDDAGAWGMIF